MGAARIQIDSATVESSHSIRTATWELSLPDDWKEEEDTENGTQYLESGDGQKGIYIATWNLGPGSSKDAFQVLSSFKSVDLKTLREMEDRTWKIMTDVTAELDGAWIATIDAYDVVKSHRIAGKLLARPPIVVRASFHDYQCDDYSASVTYFDPIIASLRLFNCQ